MRFMHQNTWKNSYGLFDYASLTSFAIPAYCCLRLYRWLLVIWLLLLSVVVGKVVNVVLVVVVDTIVLLPSVAVVGGFFVLCGLRWNRRTEASDPWPVKPSEIREWDVLHIVLCRPYTARSHYSAITVMDPSLWQFIPSFLVGWTGEACRGCARRERPRDECPEGAKVFRGIMCRFI